MIKKLYIILCVCMKISLVAAQTIIQGSVLNEQGKATEAFVMVSPKGTGSILAFADADAKVQIASMKSKQLWRFLSKCGLLYIHLDKNSLIPGRRRMMVVKGRRKDRMYKLLYFFRKKH